MEKSQWENHYRRDRSILTYPDENLVRLLKKFSEEHNNLPDITALDLGCGSGRHIVLIEEMGISKILGMDNSFEALKICQKNFNFPVITGDNRKIPLKSNSIDIVIAWGSLHYSHKKEISNQVNEINRILKPGGVLLATLRSNKDTHLSKGKHLGQNSWITDLNDISGSIVSFYKEKELKKIFHNYNNLEIGLMERSVMGDLKKIISHWIIKAKKEKK